MEYEEYMRNVLGYNQMPNNMYVNPYDDYYYDTQYINNQENVDNELIESMYPEIYRMVYPMIRKICMQNGQRDVSRNLVDSMTDEIYSNMEQDDIPVQGPNQRTSLKNGDVRNPNAKEQDTRGETRQSNFLLRDLIKILILRELSSRPNFRPPWQRPPRPGQGRPPQRPPQMPYNQTPPLWRQY